jgi:hypothetical protein
VTSVHPSGFLGPLTQLPQFVLLGALMVLISTSALQLILLSLQSNLISSDSNLISNDPLGESISHPLHKSKPFLGVASS